MEYFVLQFQLFMLIMLRLLAMMVIAPFYSSPMIPFRMRFGLAFLVSLVILPVIAHNGYYLTTDMSKYFMLALREIGIGLFIGFLVAIIFASFQLASQMYIAQIGFGMSEVLDPLAEISIPVIGQLKNMIGILVFLAMDGQHYMIKAINRSYELAPVNVLTQTHWGLFLKFIDHSFSGMFVVAIKLALPVMATIFLITVAEGVLAKVAPQMNIMMLGFPIKIIVTFGLLAFTAPLIVRIMNVSLERTFKFISQILANWPT